LEHRTGKTTILITHRPSVIHRANWIVLIEKGQVQIQGTPQTFLSKPGEHLQFLTV